MRASRFWARLLMRTPICTAPRRRSRNSGMTSCSACGSRRPSASITHTTTSECDVPAISSLVRRCWIAALSASPLPSRACGRVRWNRWTLGSGKERTISAVPSSEPSSITMISTPGWSRPARRCRLAPSTRSSLRHGTTKTTLRWSSSEAIRTRRSWQLLGSNRESTRMKRPYSTLTTTRTTASRRTRSTRWPKSRITRGLRGARRGGRGPAAAGVPAPPRAPPGPWPAGARPAGGGGGAGATW